MRLSRSIVFVVWVCCGGAAFAQDTDADGWTAADGDCCDRVEDGCPVPAKVNPGAYDVEGNGFDDDCDGVADNPAPTTCSPVPRFGSMSGLLLAQAMDLCQTTAAAPPLPERRWGLIDATLLRADGSAPGPADIQTAVFGDFGVNAPRLNATMAGISSGTARDGSDPGYRNPELETSYQSGTAAVSAPARLVEAHGGSLITFPGCNEAGPLVHDSVLLRLRIRVPTNAAGFAFDHKFYTAEWPDVCTEFNDHLVALLDSQVAGLPADGNIVFDAQTNPVTVQTVFYEVCSGCVEGNGELSGTGYGPTTGGGTHWHTAGAPVVPGEEIVLDIHIWDATDGLTDSLALLDAFRWIGVLNDDSDGDGVFDLYDCAPAQAGTWLAPSAARSLTLSGGAAGLTLEWQPPLERGGTEITYDILRSADPADFTDATCVVTATPATSAGIVPDAGNEFYLVRSRNTCGGTLGSDSSGTERIGPFCP